MRIGIILALLLGFACKMQSQQTILKKPEVLEKVETCLYATYSFSFSEAEKNQNDLSAILKDHPAPHFLQALIIYWKHFPLLPEDEAVAEFEKAIENTISAASELVEKEDGQMEGIFFDMHARAFRSMFWADNGKAAKVLKDLDNMYRSTMTGIELKDEFNEFYFSSGLYNYYIEAYVDEHPIYAPRAVLFRKGDRQRGLQELEYAIYNTVFIKYEALLFMSLIQLNYERNLNKAADYVSMLYNNFPDNIYYLGQYLIILLYSKNYALAQALASKLKDQQDPFHILIYTMTRAFLLENSSNRLDEAKKTYLQCISFSENFGPIANLYASVSNAGLARIFEKEGDIKMARKYKRRSAALSSYEFILDF